MLLHALCIGSADFALGRAPHFRAPVRALMGVRDVTIADDRIEPAAAAQRLHKLDRATAPGAERFRLETPPAKHSKMPLDRAARLTAPARNGTSCLVLALCLGLAVCPASAQTFAVASGPCTLDQHAGVHCVVSPNYPHHQVLIGGRL